MEKLISYFQLILLMAYITACQSGMKKTFHENGKLASILRFDEAGQLHGRCEWYYPNGMKQMESEYSHNILDGLQIRYHESGQKQSVIVYRNGLMDSSASYYSVYGDLIAVEKYRNDTLDGGYQRFYESGQLMLEGDYVQGWMHGIWLFYDQDGIIVGKAEFNMGDGIQKGYSSNGKLSRIIHYHQNLKHGPEEYYDFEGRHIKTLHYQYGVVEHEEIFLPD